MYESSHSSVAGSVMGPLGRVTGSVTEAMKARALIRWGAYGSRRDWRSFQALAPFRRT